MERGRQTQAQGESHAKLRYRATVKSLQCHRQRERNLKLPDFSLDSRDSVALPSLGLEFAASRLRFLFRNMCLLFRTVCLWNSVMAVLASDNTNVRGLI